MTSVTDADHKALDEIWSASIRSIGKDRDDTPFLEILARRREAAMIEGARLMREAILPEIKTDRTIEKHGGHCRCVTCELNITEDIICDLDPATVIKEVE